MYAYRAAIAAFVLGVICILAWPAPARASDWSEWASMTQVLVLRWQGDPQFDGKTNEDVKKELSKTMGLHPEITTAFKWVDYAYKHRKEESRKVWKSAYDLCASVAI